MLPLNKKIAWLNPKDHSKFLLGSSLSPLDKILRLFGVGDTGAVFVPGIGSLTAATKAIDEAGAGDPVGFQLDLSQGAGFSGGAFTGLGSEEVTNGGFDTDSDWTKGSGWTISGGAASFDAGTGAELIQTGFSFLAGTTYQIEFDMVQTSGAGFRFVVDTSGTFVSQYFNSTARHKLIFSVGASSSRLRLGALGGAVFSIDNISIKEIPGNHVYQLIDAARPTRRASPVHLEDDGVDDALLWTAPADTYTVARVNSAGTVTIQTGQSLSGATDVMLETTIAGYLSINRSLTAGETTTLTAWLQGLAP